MIKSEAVNQIFHLKVSPNQCRKSKGQWPKSILRTRQCDVNVKSMWSQLEVNVESMRSQREVNVKSMWSQCGVNVEST